MPQTQELGRPHGTGLLAKAHHVAMQRRLAVANARA